MVKRLGFLVIAVCVNNLFAQGYFYTEGTVQINGGAFVEVKGNAEINKSIDGDGFMIMAGDNPQNLGGTDALMNNLSVQNNATVNMVAEVSVLDTLEMFSGTLLLNDYDLIMGDDSYQSGNQNGFITTGGLGKIQRKMDTSPFTFHTGWGLEYFPLTLSEMGSVDTFRIQAWDLISDDGTYWGVPITSHVALLSYSIQDQNPGGNNLSISMQWRDTRNAFNFVESHAVGIWYNGSGYEEMDNCPTNVSSMDPNIVSYTGVANTGTFGIGDSVYLTNIPQAWITPGDTAVCEGTLVTYSAFPSSNVQYLWSTSDTTQTLDIGTTGAYWVDVIDSTGCSYQSNTINFTAWPLPSSPTILQNINTLSVNPIYSMYQWYLNGNPISGANSSDYTVTGNGMYTCVVSDTNGCTNTSSSYNFNTFSLDDELFSNLYVVGQNQQIFIGMEPNSDIQISVYDGLGRVIYQAPFINQVIPLTVAPGIYFLSLDMLTSNGMPRIKKVFIY